jgi:hypothetical protein
MTRRLRIWWEVMGLVLPGSRGADHGADWAGWPSAFHVGSTSPHAKDGQDMTEHQDDHRESVVKEPGHHLSESATREKRPKGFLNPRTIKLFSFMTISICIVGSVFVSILAIWDFTKSDVWYRSLATLAVIAIGTAIFAVVNEKFGD